MHWNGYIFWHPPYGRLSMYSLVRLISDLMHREEAWKCYETTGSFSATRYLYRLQVSIAAVVGFIYTAIAIVIRAWQITSARSAPFSDILLFRGDFGALFAIPIIVFGFNSHANVVTIFT